MDKTSDDRAIDAPGRGGIQPRPETTGVRLARRAALFALIVLSCLGLVAVVSIALEVFRDHVA